MFHFFGFVLFFGMQKGGTWQHGGGGRGGEKSQERVVGGMAKGGMAMEAVF